MTKRPYKELEGSPLWVTLEASISALVTNGDIGLSTSKEHVIGYLCEAITNSGARTGMD